MCFHSCSRPMPQYTYRNVMKAVQNLYWLFWTTANLLQVRRTIQLRLTARSQSLLSTWKKKCRRVILIRLELTSSAKRYSRSTLHDININGTQNWWIYRHKSMHQWICISEKISLMFMIVEKLIDSNFFT